MNDDTPTAASPRRASFNIFTAFLLVATLALSLLVLLLMRQNRDLRSEATALRQLTGEAALPRGEMLTSLDTFAPPPPATADLHPAGTPDTMAFLDGRLGTFLYLFSSSCGSCETIMPRVAALSARHTPSGVECYAIQIDANTPEDLVNTTLGLPVRGVYEAPRTWLRRIPLVPALVLIDHNGVLVHAWYGAPDEPQWTQIQSQLAALSGAEASRSPPK